jgi:hypothetical protein
VAVVATRAEIDCPRAKTWMTPCIARDAATALDDSPKPPAKYRSPQCVGCGADARELLLDLSERYEPARRYRQTHDPVACADTLTRMVAEYVER